jgi:hypothetical protein
MSDLNEPKIEAPAVALAASELEVVTIQILGFTSETVTVKYRTLPGNRPELNGDTLWLWEGTVIDWTHPDQGVREPVRNNDSQGSSTMTVVAIGRKHYTVGFSVTGGVMGICASGLVNATGLLLAPTSVTIGIETLKDEKLVIRYATLRGYRPRSGGNWLGLWRGDVLPEEAPPPIEVALPEDDANEGLATFHTKFRPTSTYTVIYFMADGDKQTDNTSAAALLRFDTA